MPCYCSHFCQLIGQHPIQRNHIQCYIVISDENGSPIDSLGTASGRSTLVVVRDGAVPKMTLESNDLQLLHDIPEFKVSIVGLHVRLRGYDV